MGVCNLREITPDKPYTLCTVIQGNGAGKLLDPRKRPIERIVRFGDSCQVRDAHDFSTFLSFHQKLISQNLCLITLILGSNIFDSTEIVCIFS